MPCPLESAERSSADLRAHAAAHAWHLAAGLRQAVISVHRHETANAARTGIAEKLYDYLATGGFGARADSS